MNKMTRILISFLSLSIIFTGISCKANKRYFMILSINDVYRINGLYDGTVGGLARIRTLRAELEQQHPDLLFLHAGDFLFPSLLSQQFKGEQMIDIMNLLDGKEDSNDDLLFAAFGNHEFDKSRMKDVPMLQNRIESSEFSWVSSNFEFKKDGEQNPLIDSENIIKSAILLCNGVRV
ncbi:MAG: metallophosphoesterase, partial [Leptospirales bacterium]